MASTTPFASISTRPFRVFTRQPHCFCLIQCFFPRLFISRVQCLEQFGHPAVLARRGIPHSEPPGRLLQPGLKPGAVLFSLGHGIENLIGEHFVEIRTSAAH